MLGVFFQVQRTAIIRTNFKYSGALHLFDDLLFGFYKHYRCATPDSSKKASLVKSEIPDFSSFIGIAAELRNVCRF
jgi:hypothetical protein